MKIVNPYRTYSNTLNLTKPPDKPARFTVLARVSGLRICQFKPQEIANTAWAFAVANQSEEKLFATLATASERNVGRFKPQELANVALAFAKAN